MKIQYYSTGTNGELVIRTIIGVNEVLVEGKLVHINHSFGIYDVKDLKHLYIESKGGFSVEGSRVTARLCENDGCIVDVRCHQKKLNISFGCENASENININGNIIFNPYSIHITEITRFKQC